MINSKKTNKSSLGPMLNKKGNQRLQKHLMERKGAMEMSVGTIVTIVLLMSVLVLGIFLVQNIFGGSQDAVDAINTQVQNEINKLFSEEGKSVAVYPGSREVSVNKGDSPKGFAFSINNKDVEMHTYTYEVRALESFDFAGRCGSAMTMARANGYLLASKGTVRLAASSQMEIPELVMYQIPESASSCTIPYKLMIDDENGPYQDVTIFVTIK